MSSKTRKNEDKKLSNGKDTVAKAQGTSPSKVKLTMQRRTGNLTKGKKNDVIVKRSKLGTYHGWTVTGKKEGYNTPFKQMLNDEDYATKNKVNGKFARRAQDGSNNTMQSGYKQEAWEQFLYIPEDEGTLTSLCQSGLHLTRCLNETLYQHPQYFQQQKQAYNEK